VSCREFVADVHPDHLVPEVDEEERSIRIDTVRGLIRDMNMRPVRGRRRVALLPKAERLGEEAQNALLKSLEEPAGDALWILTAEDPAKLLATVRSRASPVRFGRLSASTLADLLQQAGAAASAQARHIANAAEGSYTRAARMSEEGWADERAFVDEEVMPRVGAGPAVGPALARALITRSASVKRKPSAPRADSRAGHAGKRGSRSGGLEEARRPALRVLSMLADRLRQEMRVAAESGPAEAEYWSGKLKVVLDSGAAIRQNVRSELALAAAAARLAAANR
jgi:hypothetical protein